MKTVWFSPLTWILFFLALLPRLFDLDQFIISDENTNIFLAGSAVVQAFLRGDFRATYWHFYPGVTMSWADALGLVGQWGWSKLSGATTAPLVEFVDSDIRTILPAVRLPYAILTALFVPALYHLLWRWFAPPGPARPHPAVRLLAVTAALLVAFDPFFLAHSRVVHGDAPVSVFMVLSILALFLYLRHDSTRLFYFSAVMGSLAALTKAPGQLMAPLVCLILTGDWLRAVWAERSGAWPLARRRLVDIVRWGLIALAVLVLLWPSMWVDPLGTLGQMLDETFGKVNEGHLVFFQGQPTLDPGPWFYSYIILFRLTPLVSLGLGLSLVWLAVWAWRPGGMAERAEAGGWRAVWGAAVLLWLMVLLLLWSGNLSPKKQDRYLLPLFPLLDMLAAIGWFGLFYWLRTALFKGRFKPIAFRLLALGLVGGQIWAMGPYHPYYLAYFNPWLGGLPRAVQTTLIGWGEGMELAADYLNRKPGAESLYVAATPSQTLLPYFKGRGENFYTNDIALRADYVVIYRAQQQRRAPSPEIVDYFMAQQPEQVITIRGVPYAWIYPNQPLIFSEVPAWGQLTNIGFAQVTRLAGYHVAPADDGLTVDLFWHALPALENDLGPCHQARVENIETTLCPRIDYTVSLRLLAPDGHPVGQHDSWPAGGLLPTSLWRPGDYVQDRHPLTLPPDLPPGTYQLAVVIYDSATGRVLAGPLTFAEQVF